MEHNTTTAAAHSLVAAGSKALGITERHMSLFQFCVRGSSTETPGNSAVKVALANSRTENFPSSKEVSFKSIISKYYRFSVVIITAQISHSRRLPNCRYTNQGAFCRRCRRRRRRRRRLCSSGCQGHSHQTAASQAACEQLNTPIQLPSQNGS